MSSDLLPEHEPLTPKERNRLVEVIMQSRVANPPVPRLSIMQRDELRALVESGREGEAWVECQYLEQVAFGKAMANSRAAMAKAPPITHEQIAKAIQARQTRRTHIPVEREKKLNSTQSRLVEIIEALEDYAKKVKQDFDRHTMPGPLGEDWQHEGSFHWLCAKIDPAFKKAKATFKKHRAGLCALEKYADKSDFYRQALPHIVQTLVPIDTRKIVEKIKKY